MLDGQVRIISFIQASKLVEQGCLAYLARVKHYEMEVPLIGSITVVSKVNEVPHDRDIDFCIYLEPGMRHISIPPYRMAPVELRDRMAQIQELLYKGFICPSSSPWGAQVCLLRTTMVE